MSLLFRIGVGVLGTAVFLGTAAAVVTSDAFVRRVVRTALSRTLRAPAHVESASFTFSEGLVVRGLQVLDPYDPTGLPAVEVETLRADYQIAPSGDAVRLTSVVLVHPVVRVRRMRDGTLSVAALLQPLPQDGEAVEPPTIRIEGGTCTFDDPALFAGDAPVELQGVTASAVPSGGSWKFEVTGRARELGEVRATISLDADGAGSATADVPALPVGPELLRRLELPGAAEALEAGAQGTIPVRVDATWAPDRPRELHATAKLAGMTAEVTIPGAQAVPARAIPVTVTSGDAELGGGSVVVRDLRVETLGSVLRCAEAHLDGLGGGAPTLSTSATVEGLVVGDALRPHLPDSVLRVLDAYSLSGRIDGSVSIEGPLAAPQVRAEAKLREGHLRYEGYLHDDGVRHGFPWDVDDVTADVTYEDGPRVTLVAAGRHGATPVRATGRLDYRTGEEIPRITIVGEDVPLDADLRAGFQDRAERLYDRWGPGGIAKRIQVDVLRDPHVDGPVGETVPVRIELDGRATLRPRALPMPLRDVHGLVEVVYPAEGEKRIERVALHEIRATGEGIELELDGRVDTDGDVTREDVRVLARISEAAGPVRDGIAGSREFVPASVQRLFEDLGLTGSFDVAVDVAADGDRRSDRLSATLHRVAVTGYRDVPFAATDVTGLVRVEGDVAELEGIRCTALGVPVTGSGRLLGVESGDVEPDVTVEAPGVPIGGPLRQALGPIAERAAEFWETLGPVGADGVRGTRADVSVTLRPSTGETPVEVRLRRISGALRPVGIDLDLSDGELDYDGRTVVARADAAVGGARIRLHEARLDVASGRLEVAADCESMRFPEDVEALFSDETAASIRESFPGRAVELGGLRLTWDPEQERLDLSGELTVAARTRKDAKGPGLRPAGKATVERLTFWLPPGLPVRFDGSLRANGFRIRPGLQVEELSGQVALVGRLDDDGAEILARTRGARMKVEDHPLADATVDVVSDWRGVSVNATAAYRGGSLAADVRPGPAGPQGWAGLIRLSGADLSKIASKDSGLKGTVDAEVRLRNRTGEKEDLRGTVVATVRDGDLGRFPLFSSIWDVISAATLFLLPTGDLREGRLEAGIVGTEMRVNKLEISGPILKLHDATGTIGFDGRLAVNLSAFLGFPPISVPMHVAGTVNDPKVGLLRRAEREREPAGSGEDAR